MTPNVFAKAVRSLEKVDRIDELAGTLVFFCSLSADTDRNAWLSLADKPPEFIESISIVYEGTDISLSRDDSKTPEQAFMVTVRKRIANGELRFFLCNALNDKNLKVLSSASLIRIAEMGATETFSTLLARVESWTVDAGAQYASAEPLVSPLRLVRDFTPGASEVSSDVRPWLLRTGPNPAGRAFESWKRLASPRLLAALANEVSEIDGHVIYLFTGPPKRSLHAPEQFDDLLSDELQTAARWVYFEGRDPEARHILFSNELARAHEAGVPASVVKRSLESAASAYNAHVKSGSRETLKALADLRKAVFEETQKISQRAQDLAGSLWKDVAIAAAPFVLKTLLDSGKGVDVLVSSFFPIGAGLFLIFSFSIQVYVNHRFFKHQDDARVIWKRALNVALTSDELEQLSETPIKQSLCDYRKVRLAVGLVYVALVFVLLKVGVDHLPADWLSSIGQSQEATMVTLNKVATWMSRQM